MSNTRSQSSLTRRQLLQSAGGITFSALIATQHGGFAAMLDPGNRPETVLPVFTAFPYLQPGPTSDRLIEGNETIVIAWQTDGAAAAFDLEYGPENKPGKKAAITSQERLPAGPDGSGRRVNYVATLSGLHLDKRYTYRFRMNGNRLLEGYFTTRKPRGAKTRFVAFGDNSCGQASDHAIAYYTYQAHPDFVMNTGDNVYEAGRNSEYERYFFPVYNADTAGPGTGAPLLRSVPFYSVIANHDITGSDAHHRPGLNFNRYADGGAYYTNWHFPLNGPTPALETAAFGDATAVAQFKAAAGPRHPNMANYSFDYGDAHFLCLDANVYIDPTDAALQEWIARDLSATDATWKFVVYHHPAYNVGHEHYTEQQMRVLSPLFERHGVDIVLSGHEHNYQRTRPLRFAPRDDAGAKLVNSGRRHVPGTFTVDTKFDGTTITRPDGILYITTGAGGNSLYDPDSNNNPPAWRHPEDDNVEYVAKMISDRHSLTLVEVSGKELQFTQIDESGQEIDRYQVTKA